MTITDTPLYVEVTRGGRPEAVHEAHVVACDSEGKILGRFGDMELATYERSLAKPLQLLAVMLERPSLLDECSHEEIAIMSASHSGEPKHLETLYGLLDRYSLDKSLLLCGYHPPIWLTYNWKHGTQEFTIEPIYHNCSGKHIAFLLACQEKGWPMDTYNMPDHPIQVAIRHLMARYAEYDPDELQYGPDGCGVPTWWLDLKSIAVASARFGDPDFFDDEIELKVRDSIFEAYHKASWWTAGTKRFGDCFNRESDGKWLGKIGGEAVFGVCFRDRGIGIAIKVRDGNPRALAPALLHAMKVWDLITDDQLSRLSHWVEIKRKNAPGWDIGWVRMLV